MAQDSNFMSQRLIATTPIRNPTTSFLTAIALTHTIRARITIATSTRLALQLILNMIFK